MLDDLRKKIDDYFANVSDEQFLSDLKAAGFILVPRMTPNGTLHSGEEVNSMARKKGKRKTRRGGGC